MKRGTPRNPKTEDLAEALGREFAAAIGYLELLWHFTAEFAPRGDVGRFSNERIEAACRWKGARGRLISALTETRWLDTDHIHRLVVHDWSEHADESVRQRLKRANEWFVIDTAKVKGKTASTEGQITRLPLPSHKPKPEPVPTAVASPPNGTGWHPNIERFLSEYPGKIRPDADARLYVSYVTSADLEGILFANLAKWRESDQWRDGYIEGAGKWLETGCWKVPPKSIPKKRGQVEHPDFLPEQ